MRPLLRGKVCVHRSVFFCANISIALKVSSIPEGYLMRMPIQEVCSLQVLTMHDILQACVSHSNG